MRYLLGLLLLIGSGVAFAQATSPLSVTKSMEFTLTTTTLVTTEYSLPGDQLGVYNSVEATINVQDVDADGTVTVILMSTLDDGVTTSTVFTKQILLSSADVNGKIQAVRTFGVSPIYFGRKHQLKVSAITDAVDVLTVISRLYYTFN